MSEPVRCEQVVLGWSANSLLGGDGFGPVFASAGWRLPLGDRDAGLGPRARFLDQGAATLVSDGAAPPRCLAYERTEAGTLLISKAYAAGAARPGQYVVHALLDPTRTLRPRDLFGCAESGLLLGRAACRGGGPRLAGGRWCRGSRRERRPAWTAAEQAVLAVLLRCLAERRPMVHPPAGDQERAAQLVRQVVEVLPDGLAARAGPGHLRQRPGGSGLGVCVAVPPFSRISGEFDLDLDGALPAPDRATAAVVAALTAAGSEARAGPGDQRCRAVRAGRSCESAGWTDLAADDIRRLLAGPLWRTFLDRVDETGPTSLLLDGLVDAEIRPALAGRLAEPDAELAELLARAVARPTGLDAARPGSPAGPAGLGARPQRLRPVRAARGAPAGQARANRW